MRIDQIKLNATVHCPADRGEAAYTGTVTHIGQDRQKAFNGVEYVWVSVRRNAGGTTHVWPSNRLS